MTEGSIISAPRQFRRRFTPLVLLIAGLLAFALSCVFVLEQRFAGLEREEIRVGQTPVTVYAEPRDTPLPVVVVAHGFGGSRQMMDQISVTVARAGYRVAAFDFPGHGRNPVPMSADVTSLEGTTAQLVRATEAVAQAMLERDDTTDELSFVGHSMATDVVIRATRSFDATASIVAISMYSEAVTPEHPQRLLVVSGASETRLREVALDAMHQIEPTATEGQIVSDGSVTRRALSAPWVGHVGVLYSPVTLHAMADWISEQSGTEPPRLDGTGWVAGALMLALAALAWPLSRLLPQRDVSGPSLSSRSFVWIALMPAPLSIAAAYVAPPAIAGLQGLGALVVFLLSWGVLQLAGLYRAGCRPPRPDALGAVALLAWGLMVFAVALDRYGAAFLPTGPRMMAMAVLALATVPLCIADQRLLTAAPWWRRIAARFCLFVSLAGAMMLSPADMGLTFTVLPVLVLFWLVYGSFARWVATRRGDGATGVASGIILAWALAASTPLFAVSVPG